ncbi:MAG: hypothetical protein RJB66_2387 [Pseudomonadota bacterium]|jgi:transcription-repair coupling factor (superfamily II helicase)
MIAPHMKIGYLHPHLETILERQFTLTKKNIELVGAHSSLALVFLLAQTYSKQINDLPHLIVTSSLEEAESIKRQLGVFHCPKAVHILPFYDVSPYSTLIPNEFVTKHRLGWLHAAADAKPGDIFVAPVQALQQKTLPFNELKKNSFKLVQGEELDPQIAKQLAALGYQSSPLVEDPGQFALRGGIVDIFSPAHGHPLRIELFGDLIESIRLFSSETQRTLKVLNEAYIIPSHEVLFHQETIEGVLAKFRSSVQGRPVQKEDLDETLRSLAREQYFSGIDFMLPFFYETCVSPLEHFSSALNVWYLDYIEINRTSDLFVEEAKQGYANSDGLTIRPLWSDLFDSLEQLQIPIESRKIRLNRIVLNDNDETDEFESIDYQALVPSEFASQIQGHTAGSETWLKTIEARLKLWKKDDYTIFIFGRNHQQSDRLKHLLERADFRAVVTADDEFLLEDWSLLQKRDERLIHILPAYLDQSLRWTTEKTIFLRDDDFFGSKSRLKKSQAQKEIQKQIERLSFGDLNPGDYVVHIKHGVGKYEGLKVMPVNGIDAEFIQIAYKDKDKLYLPVYRIAQLQKYSSGLATVSVDKLGGTSWEKAKVKVKAHLRDIANELLQLYAQRSQMQRPSFSAPDKDFAAFEAGFPYDETDDQLRAISDVVSDLTSPRPMDRLICGDVGFGKTEVAMRAAFKAVQDRRQVAILAPTTVLSFQHFETFKKRFKGWPIEIRELNRFVSPADAKKTLIDAKEGRVDILIGTHRILSKDVLFKNLGLLIVDEEQKFGVTHKERIRKMRVAIDTLTLSATPIPRTLNMSLVGIRDLSFINTPPVDRLPTRTYTCKFDQETIRKAITAEVSRGGQVYFIHNRVQSIYGIADELRAFLPDIRIKVAHGQMNEEELEQTMVSFFSHEIDVLVCTTIVESGVDVPRANTIFVDNAHQLGLSQLYQLRGRVGRSKQRAYCYLLIPKGKNIDKEAQERLRVIQENTALGSGMVVAQHDLELRGAGNILGEEQSGTVDLVGYELYMDLLSETLAEAKGETPPDLELEPEINLRIPALIPDTYIQDIRLRLSYYKALANIQSQDDLADLEDDLKDQFGALPEPVLNLMGLMLLRLKCKQLGIRDLTTGLKTLSLIFSDRTPLRTEVVIQLAMRENKKYSISPDSRLTIRMNQISMQRIFEELESLEKLI